MNLEDLIDWVVLGIALGLGSAMLFPLKAHSEGVELLVTVGIGKDVAAHQPFERLGMLGIRCGGPTWKVKTNAGYWLALAEGQKASIFGSLQAEYEVRSASGATLSWAFGPAGIQNPDAKLSGHFQFHFTFAAGLVQIGGQSVRLTWEHFSNAGIVLPNNGRDIWGLNSAFPL